MRKFIILSLTFTGLMADASAATLPAGSEVHLRTTAAISSRDAQVSGRVEFRVDEDVTAGKVIVIPKGSLAWGTVADAAPRGRMGRSGRLAVDIQSVCLADGGAAPLRGSDPRGAERKHRAKSEGAADAMAAVPAWPILLFMMGKDINIAEGAEVTAFLDAPVTVDDTKLRNAPATVCAGAPHASPSGDAAVANVRSDPDGAEIQVDGHYAGNTPSRLRLAPGDHRVLVTLRGRETWQRDVTIGAGGELTIFATFAPPQAIAGSRAIQ